jgi:hypothetical protein
MPTPTYVALANITLGSSATSVTFSSIPTSGYRDLVLVQAGVTTTSAIDALVLRFNGDTGSNYSHIHIEGEGGGATPGTDTSNNITFMITGLTGTSQTNSIISLLDYSATDKQKSMLSRSNAALNRLRANTGRYASTSAITSIAVFTFSGLSFAAGSTFSLYGIAS